MKLFHNSISAKHLTFVAKIFLKMESASFHACLPTGHTCLWTSQNSPYFITLIISFHMLNKKTFKKHIQALIIY